MLLASQCAKPRPAIVHLGRVEMFHLPLDTSRRQDELRIRAGLLCHGISTAFRIGASGLRSSVSQYGEAGLVVPVGHLLRHRLGRAPTSLLQVDRLLSFVVVPLDGRSNSRLGSFPALLDDQRDSATVGN